MISSKRWGAQALTTATASVLVVETGESAVLAELHMCNTSERHARVWVDINGTRFATWELWPEGSSRLALPPLVAGDTVSARASTAGVYCRASGGSKT